MYTDDSFKIQLDNAPLDLNDKTELSLYPDCVIISELDEYDITDGQATKRFGKRIGIYHPIMSSILVLDEFEWRVYDTLLKNSSICVKQLKQFYQSELSKLMATLKEFHRFGVVLKDTEQLAFDIQSEHRSADLYVNVTERCNFSCPGCATASDIIMPSQAKSLDIATIVLFLEHFVYDCAEKEFTRSRIKWAGGEPLFNESYRAIVAAQETVQKMKGLYPGIDIEQVIITNGVFLNAEKVDFILEHNIHVSVSLWGTELYQDAVRRPRNKRETFPIIIENIHRLQDTGASYNINYVLTPENAVDFPEFLSIMWDVEHPDFVSKHWQNKQPIPLSINFFRPQSQSQIENVYKSFYEMETGLRLGFARILDMIKRGIKVQPLHKIDYLDLFNLITTSCGTGFSYIAVGPKGAAPCHEGLFEMKPNLDRIKRGENMFDIVNEYYGHDQELLQGKNISFQRGKNLMLHGGQGCPRLAEVENNGKLGVTASTSELYDAIYEELLSLETMRQFI